MSDIREVPEEHEVIARDTSGDEEGFDDDEGYHPLPKSPYERELVTTPLDAPVRTLVQDIQDKTLIVNPPFQRGRVWTTPQKSRLIESLLLNIPIPVIFLADDEDGKRVGVDGQQRLRAIEEFVSGQYRLIKLEVLERMNNKRWTDLTPRESRQINNRTIRCIIISERSDPDIRFEVFERLNTGVTPLNDQELRNCLHRGSFNELLDRLAHDKTWLRLVRKEEPDNRLRHHELILRYFALREVIGDYRPPLKKILNEFMRTHRHESAHNLARLKEDFTHAIRSVDMVFGPRAFRRIKVTDQGSVWDNALNRAVFDVQMLGLSGADQVAVRDRAAQIVEGFEHLCRHDDNFVDSITKATADRTKVDVRIRSFVDMLGRVGAANHVLRRALPVE